MLDPLMNAFCYLGAFLSKGEVIHYDGRYRYGAGDNVESLGP